MNLSFRSRLVISAAAGLALISSGVPAAAVEPPTSCGTLVGTVYEVRSETDLACLAIGTAAVRGPDRSYAQTVNLNLSMFTNWEPIGSAESPFYGRYDGRNHKISNLKIAVKTAGSLANYGLFGYVDAWYDETAGAYQPTTGVVANLALDTVNISVESTDAGVTMVGGLVGYTGTALSKVAVYNATINVTGTDLSAIGGVAGMGGADFSQVGAMEGTINLTASGGILGVGGVTGSGLNFSNSFATEAIYTNQAATSRSYIGGLTGDALSISNSFATGPTFGGTETGGLVGSPADPTAITSSYWLAGYCTGTPCNDYGTALSPSAMQEPATYVGWDFGSYTAGKAAKAKTYPMPSKRPGGGLVPGVWGDCPTAIGNNFGRPYLVWQALAEGWTCAAWGPYL